MRSLTLATTVAAALVVAGCVKVDVPERAFFWPDARLAAENVTLPVHPMPPGSETLALRYAEGPIGATRVRSGRADAPLILFCGGNMFRRSAGAGPRGDILAPFGDAVMFDYPGYGDTAGLDTFANFRAAGEAIADEARRQADAEGRRLIVWGHSLGSVVCAQGAKRVRADALVLETPTPGARATVDNQVGLLRPFVRVNLAPALASIDVPASLDGFVGRIIVLEAGRDDTLPPALSRALTRQLEARGHRVQRMVFPRAGHSDIGEQPDFPTRMAEALSF